MDYPTIQVATLCPGASPDVIASAITAPLERQFGQMSGLKQMSTQSSGGASVITLQFQLTLAVTSSAMPMTQVQDMVETRIAQKMAQVSGVGRVSLAGGQRPSVRVNFNANALAS